MLSTPPGEAANAEPERRSAWVHRDLVRKVVSWVGLGFFVGFGGYVAVHAEAHPVVAAAWLSLVGLVASIMGEAPREKAEAEA